MKKVLSAILSAVMLFGMCTALPVSAEPIGWDVHEEVDLRVGILTDTHMRNGDKTTDIVNHILDSQVEIANGKIDGMALVGDVTFYNGTEDCSDIRHYQNMYASINEKMPGAQILYAMGNHEFPLAQYDEATSEKAHAAFVEGTGQPLNEHKIFGDGYHFIAMAPKDANSILAEDTKSWAMQEIENAIGADSTNAVLGEDGNYSFPEGTVPDSEKPVFVLLHAPMTNTMLWGNNGGDVAEFVSYLKTRPQVVMIHGHLHASAYLPSTIWQDGFTAFQGSINDGHYIDDKAFSESYTASDAYTHQGSMLEVEDNIVKFYKLDYDNNEEIGTPWIVDIPQIVKNLRDDNPDNDGDAYLYTDEKRAKVTSTAQFPDGTEVTAEAVSLTGVEVSYPNTAYMTSFDAIQQDNFIRGYKIEAVNNGGYVVSTLTHQADYYLKPEKRKASYTKTLSGLEAGESYTINVYPMMPLGVYGSFGTPISTKVTMPQDPSKKDAIRYEIEDFCPETKLNKSSIYASGGGICIAAQGGMVAGAVQLDRPADGESPFTFDFEIDLPVDGNYKIEYGVGYRNSHNLSKVTLTLDDTIVIGDNMKRGNVDRSLGNTYPWGLNIPLYTYYAEAQNLKAGKHKVTVTVDLPTATTQPYLFCADYIEFDPTLPFVDLSTPARIEFEDYISGVSIEETDGTPAAPYVIEWANCSGGAYMAIDTNDNLATNTYETFSIPLRVIQEGYYEMEFVDCSNMSAVDFFLNSTEGTQLDAGFTSVLSTEVNESGNYTYFRPGWAVAATHSGKVLLPEGNHELIVRVKNRGGKFGDYASYLDYLEFTPCTKVMEKDKEFFIEFEEYINDFTPTQPEIRSDDLASGGAFVASGSAGTETVTLDIPVYVTDGGTYHMDAGIGQAAQLSPVTLACDGEEMYSFTLENANRHLFTETNYDVREYKFDFELEKGLHTLTFSMAPRDGWEGTAAYALDYFCITPDADGIVKAGEVTTIEFENVVKRITAVTMSDGTVLKNGTKNYVPAAYNSANCSGGKYASLDTPDGVAPDAYYDIPVKVYVKHAGTYRMKYVVAGTLTAPMVYLDYAETNITVPKVGEDSTKNASNKYAYFNSGWATAAFHAGDVYLPEGLHTVYFRTYRRGGKFNDYAQNYDFVEFTPLESFAIENGKATATVVEDRAVTGKAIMALYNEKQMVGIRSVDVENTKLITISMPVVGTVTHAKIMVWNGFDTITPLVKVKEFLVQ